MDDLRKRFGRLLAAHRRRLELTQEALAEAADLSVDMISKLETGATGARFAVIERLAEALEIDPAELFTSDLPTGSVSRGAFGKISSRLASLPEPQLVWVDSLLDVALIRDRQLPEKLQASRRGSLTNSAVSKTRSKLRKPKRK